VLAQFHQAAILIKNAANDPKVSANADLAMGRLENFSLELWLKDMRWD
jgi:hypothetical protein